MARLRLLVIVRCLPFIMLSKTQLLHVFVQDPWLFLTHRYPLPSSSPFISAPQRAGRHRMMRLRQGSCMGKVALYVHICAPFARYRRDTEGRCGTLSYGPWRGKLYCTSSNIEAVVGRASTGQGKKRLASLPCIYSVHTFCHRQGAPS